jgi:hypothetical protein
MDPLEGGDHCINIAIIHDEEPGEASIDMWGNGQDVNVARLELPIT